MDRDQLAPIEQQLLEQLGSRWESVLEESYPEVYRDLSDLRLAISSLDFIRSDRDLKLIGLSVWQEQKRYFEDLVSTCLAELYNSARQAGFTL